MADPNELLARADAEEAAEVAALEQRASPFSALYAHWERNQWSALALDLETDRRSFEALDPARRPGMVWIFAHRFHAEFSVARLLAPFLLAAPTLRRATAARDAGRRRAPPPAGRAPHLRGGLRRARRDRRRARGRRPQHGSRRRGALRAPRAPRRAPLGDLGRGRVPRGRRRLPPARRGRDRAHGPEPRRHPVRAALVPGARRGSAPGRARRGAAHRHRRLVRPPAHGAGSRADDRRDHAA